MSKVVDIQRAQLLQRIEMLTAELQQSVAELAALNTAAGSIQLNVVKSMRPKKARIKLDPRKVVLNHIERQSIKHNLNFQGNGKG